MINFTNLRLYYTCKEWLRLQSLYHDVNDVRLLRDIRRQETAIRWIVQDIEKELEESRRRVDPLQPTINNPQKN